jgi:hypothetical protein
LQVHSRLQMDPVPGAIGTPLTSRTGWIEQTSVPRQYPPGWLRNAFRKGAVSPPSRQHIWQTTEVVCTHLSQKPDSLSSWVFRLFFSVDPTFLLIPALKACATDTTGGSHVGRRSPNPVPCAPTQILRHQQVGVCPLRLRVGNPCNGVTT